MKRKVVYIYSFS